MGRYPKGLAAGPCRTGTGIVRCPDLTLGLRGPLGELTTSSGGPGELPESPKFVNDVDTCRTLVRPRLEAAGGDAPAHFHSEQTPFIDDRITLPGRKPCPLRKKFSDLLLRHTPDIRLTLLHAESDKRSAEREVQRSKVYAEILGLTFSSDAIGPGIIGSHSFTALETH